MIGFLLATDHIATETDGITKVTDHFVKETDCFQKEGRKSACVRKCVFSLDFST